MRTFKCDFCAQEKELHSSPLPDGWSRVEVKIKTVGEYIFKLDSCVGCSLYPKYFQNKPAIVSLLVAIKNGAKPKEKSEEFLEYKDGIGYVRKNG